VTTHFTTQIFILKKVSKDRARFLNGIGRKKKMGQGKKCDKAKFVIEFGEKNKGKAAKYITVQQVIYSLPDQN
jgi:hypothetical protein